MLPVISSAVVARERDTPEGGMPSSAAKMAALHVAARGAPQTLPPVAQRLRSPRSGNAQDARCPSAARPEAAPYQTSATSAASPA